MLAFGRNLVFARETMPSSAAVSTLAQTHASG